MTSEFHLEQLQNLQLFLTTKKWDVSFQRADATQNYDRVTAKIYAVVDGKNVFWPAELAFLPGLESDLKGFKILQCYVPVIAQVPAATEDSLSQMITRINTKLAIGGFGFLKTFHVLYFKHNTMLPDEHRSSDQDLVHETLRMVAYLLFNFQEAFTNVVTQKMSVDEAIKKMPFGKLYV